VLVVAVVTYNFSFAKEDIAKLEKQVDALIALPHSICTIPYPRVEDIFPVVKSVADLILHPGMVNVDFDDVKTILSGAGRVVIGIGEGSGENGVTEATRNALDAPYTERPITGAKRVLFNITSGSNISVSEINKAAKLIFDVCDKDANMIWGQVFDPDMEDTARVTVTILAADFD
jgi:cell division protein FtsZ